MSVDLKSTSGDPVSHQGDPKTDSDPLQPCSYFVAHGIRISPRNPQKEAGRSRNALGRRRQSMWTEIILGMLFDIKCRMFHRENRLQGITPRRRLLVLTRSSISDSFLVRSRGAGAQRDPAAVSILLASHFCRRIRIGVEIGTYDPPSWI